MQIRNDRSPGAASYLDATDPELCQGPAHLGSCRWVIFAVSNDFHQQRVVVRGDDSSLEGRGAIQADPHALATPEYLGGKRRAAGGERFSQNATGKRLSGWFV